MSYLLWSRLVSTCMTFVPVWFLLVALFPFKPWFGRLKWLLGLGSLLGFVLTMLMVWGRVYP